MVLRYWRKKPSWIQNKEKPPIGRSVQPEVFMCYVFTDAEMQNDTDTGAIESVWRV